MRQKISAWWQNFNPSWKLVLLVGLLVGLLSMMPYVLHVFSALNEGLTVVRDKDFGNYLSRFQRALSGYPGEASNGITPVGSGIQGMQMAGVEQILGLLLGWTGLPAAPLSVIVSAVLGVVLVMLFYQLFSELEFPPRVAFAMLLVYLVIFFGTLTRIVHPGWSFVPTLIGLICFLRFWKKPTVTMAIISGALLGWLPYLYFWSSTYVLAGAGCAVIIGVIARKKEDPFVRHWPLLILFAATVGIVMVPFVLHTFSLFSSPLFHEVSVRGDVLYQRTVESPIRTVLIFTQSIAFLWLFRLYKKDWSYLAVLALLLGITLAMHQNFIHGRVLMFASHYYPQLVISTLLAGTWVLIHKGPFIPRFLVGIIALLFLAAGFYDEARTYSFLIPTTFDYRQQHLAGAIALLQDHTEDVVLTDAETGRLVTAWTDDGIVYTTHTRFLFISDAEMAERYCVSELFLPAYPNAYRALYIEYNQHLDSAAMRGRESTLVWNACTAVRKNPELYLHKYAVTQVLWNKVERPDWKVDAKRFGLIPRASGSGWVLWDVPQK